MTSVSWVDDDEEVKASAVRWKGRTLINFAAGRSRVRALPVVIHLLPKDVDWFSSDASLFDELKLLLRERVVAATSNGDKDPEAPKSRKRARKEEVCVQGDRLQFTYRYRKTLPRYTVLSYSGDDVEGPGHSSGGGSRSSARSGQGKLPGDRDNGPEFRHLPLSESTLLVWVYRFDRDDPYRPVPNQAALQFAPKAAKTSSSSSPSSSSAVVPAAAATQEALDVEAIGRRSGAVDGTTVGAQGGPRDAGLLAWLWEGGNDGGPGDGGGGGGQGGGVRQHFIGSASWQGKPPGERRATAGGREEEDEDIQRAIQLSLATASGADGGVEESKG
eukprot:g10839.t1